MQRIIWVLAMIGVVIFPLVSHAADTVSMTDVRVEAPTSPTPKIHFDLSAPVLFQATSQRSPATITLRFPAMTWGVDDADLALPAWIDKIAINPAVNDTTLTLHLTRTFGIRQAFGLPGQDGMRLTLHLARDEGDFDISHGPYQTHQNRVQDTSRIPNPFIVVLDPGHGGRDPGAVGQNGLREKDVVLSAAKKLKNKIESINSNIKVHLTREDDVFIPLYQRIAIAHDYGADLFLSLHADSLTDSRIRGASIYTLSETATDPQTAELAMRENRAGLMDGLNLPTQDTNIAGMLVDLAYSETVQKAEMKAAILESHLRRNDTVRLLPGPHRKAAFAVLRAPDIPSLLIEIGFMSNPQEAEWMSNPDNLSSMMTSIAAAVEAYRTRLAQAN